MGLQILLCPELGLHHAFHGALPILERIALFHTFGGIGCQAVNQNKLDHVILAFVVEPLTHRGNPPYQNGLHATYADIGSRPIYATPPALEAECA
jgi:hypothetical protein